MNTVARTPQNELESLIAASDNSTAAIRAIINKLTVSRVFAVTDKPWDGRSIPRSDMRLLMVTDGENHQQPMLALFSAARHAERNTGGDHPFKNVVEVDATWTFLGVPSNAGILINPNASDVPMFRIGPGVAAELQKFAQQRLQSFANRPVPVAADNSAKPFLAEARELIAKNDFDGARALIDKVLAAAPNDNDALQMAGQIAIEDHRNADALNYFTTAVNTAPNRAAAAASMSGLGQALTWLRQYDRAEKTLLQAIQLDPQIIGPLRSLADLKVEKGEVAEAIDLYRRLTAVAPRALDLYLKIADLLVDSGQAEEALAVYDTALSLDSENAWTYFCKGVALQALGRDEEALTCHLKARELGPRQIGSYRLTSLKKYESADDPDIATLKETATDADKYGPFMRYDARFSLYEIYDELGDYRQAFENLKLGNELKHSSEIEFSLERQQEYFAKIIALFTPGFMKRFSERRKSAARPIFIIGMPRSGTTLMEQMLAGHPEIFGAGELSIMQIIALYVGSTWSERGDRFPGTDQELLADFAGATARYDRLTRHLPRGDRRLTDKMPQNFVFAGLIDLMFDDYTIIHCRRNPVATCFSCYEHIFNKNNMPFSYDLGEVAGYYKLYAALMEHWHKVMPGKILDVNYEDVVADQEGQLRRVLAHCGLEFDPACLDFHTLDRPVQTASGAQVRKPLYGSAVEKWKRYEPQLQPLIAALGDLAKGWPKTQ